MICKLNKGMNTLKGVYVLIIQVARDINITVGILGNLFFKKGLYAYVGSAQNNLELRVKRHMRKEKKLFWHIDFLLKDENVKIIEVLFLAAGKEEECIIAKELSSKGKPLDGFGCSDCACNSHLFWIKDYVFLLKFRKMSPLNLE